ncbi:hypothetical protein M9458_039302, partial [Cirrhinus mrigala]
FGHQSCGEGHHDEPGLRRHRPSFRRLREPRVAFLVHRQTDSPPAQPDSRDAPDGNIEGGLRRIPRH